MSRPDDDDDHDREFHFLDPAFTDPARIRRERQKARELRKTQWWKNLVGRGLCHYCGGRFPAAQLTLDHVVPLARGGDSSKGNCVPSCDSCNQEKGLDTPADRLLRGLREDEDR